MKKPNTAMAWLLSLVVSLVVVHCFGAGGDDGTSWLKIPASTRNAAMGESLGAVPGAVDAICINPAGLGLQERMDVSIAQNYWAQDLSIQHFAYSMGFSNGSGFALGGEYVNFGDVPLYREVGSSIMSNGSYSPKGLNLYGGYGMGLWKGLRGGVTGHYFYDNTQNNTSGNAFALDAGLLYQVAKTPFSVSAVLSDVGGKLDDVVLPRQLKTALAYQIDWRKTEKGNKTQTDDRLVLAAEGDWGLAGTAKSAAGFGAEYCFEGVLALRGGYRFKNLDNLTGVRGFSCGVGLLFKSWELDYALTTLGDFGKTHQIALNWKLGGASPKKYKKKTEKTSVVPKEYEIQHGPLLINMKGMNTKPVSEWGVQIENKTKGRIWGAQGVGDPPSDLKWDWKDQTGCSVPEGEYYVRARVRDKNGVISGYGPALVKAKFANVDVQGWTNKHVSRNVAFALNQSFSETEGYAVLKAVKEMLNNSPNGLILIEGHTDSNVALAVVSNQQLSEDRAKAVKEYLVKNGVDKNRLAAQGFGDTRPLVFNDTEEGRAQNRRVELLLFEK